MNDADRKQLAELFKLIAEFLTLPPESDYADTRQERRRYVAVDSRAAAVASFLESGAGVEVGPHSIEIIMDLLRQGMKRPLRYTPETPEQAARCKCGASRHNHGDDGRIPGSTYRDACDGFTLAAADEVRTS
jgi:hypothetical protein